QSSLAGKVSGAIAGAGKWPNRGPKKRTDLFFLNNTSKPAILLEVCFVDSSSDADSYRKNFDGIVVAIAESISGVKVPDVQPPDPPVPPDPAPPDGEDNRIDITTVKTGNMTVILNGQAVDTGDGSTTNKVTVTMQVEGDVAVTINGEDYHNPFDPEVPSAPRPTLKKGSTGPDVVTVQTCLGVTPDGDF